MIEFVTTLDGITHEWLNGFFVGWSQPPSREKHLELLRQSDYVILAIDQEKKQVVGFVTAISDGVMFAFIPLLEVLPEYQQQGIGAELMRRMLERLKDFYAVDLICDADLEAYYQRFGMKPLTGMCLRNYQALEK